MTVTAVPYGKLREHLWRGLINIEDDYIRGMLCTSSYTPNQDTHDFKDDITNEVSGTGYVISGKLLENIVLTYDAPTNTLKISADDLVWPDSTITARYLILYDGSYGSNSLMPLIGYVDFGADVVSSGGSFTVEWTDGIVLSDPVS